MVLAALSAAQKTFGAQPGSPFEAASTEPDAQIGRRRLGGAFVIALDRIRPDPAQPRQKFDAAELAELATTLREIGFLQPIIVRYVESEHSYLIVDGERRYRAALSLGLTEVPCWIQSPEQEDVLLRQVVANWQRSDLNPFELADALAVIRDTRKCSQEELAKLTGKPKSEISRLLALLAMTPEAQKGARGSDGLGKRHLYAIARAEPVQQAELVQKVKQNNLTATETERIVKRAKRTQEGSRPQGAPTTIRRFVLPAATVAITFRKREVTDAMILEALDSVREQVSRSVKNEPQPGEP